MLETYPNVLEKCPKTALASWHNAFYLWWICLWCTFNPFPQWLWKSKRWWSRRAMCLHICMGANNERLCFSKEKVVIWQCPRAGLQCLSYACSENINLWLTAFMEFRYENCLPANLPQTPWIHWCSVCVYGAKLKFHDRIQEFLLFICLTKFLNKQLH